MSNVVECIKREQAISKPGNEGIGVQAHQGPSLFREAMSRIPAAVHIVTTGGKAGCSGFTATAVCSVCEEPPRLLVCLDSRSQNLSILLQNQNFCVNVLGGDDERLAEVFAGRTGVYREQRFDVGDWRPVNNGSPLLLSAIAGFGCQVVESRRVGTHEIIIGSIDEIVFGSRSQPLVYVDRRYSKAS